MDRITNIVNDKGGFVSKGTLSGRAQYERVRRATKRGELIKVKRGVYAEPSQMMNTMIDIDLIVPGGVVCLYSAWSYYQLTTTIPPAYCVAIEAKRKVSTPSTIPVQLYYWKNDNLDFGITKQIIAGYTVKITDIERSVCDAVKYRNKIGIDICTEVIRNYLKRSDRNISRLMNYASKLRVAKTLSMYLQMGIE